MPTLHQAWATGSQTSFTVPALAIPAGHGVQVFVAGQPARYSLNSTTALVLAVAALDRQLVDVVSVPLATITRDAVLDFPSIAAQTSQQLTATVPGAAVGDVVDLGLPAAPITGLTFDAFVSAADTVTVRATNATASAIDPASATYRLLVNKA